MTRNTPSAKIATRWMTHAIAAIAMLAAARVHAGASIVSVPAASRLLTPASPPPPSFHDAQSGDWMECGDFKRRLTLLNPNLVQGEPARFRLEIARTNPDDNAKLLFEGRLIFGHELEALISPPQGQPFTYLPVPVGHVTTTTRLALGPHDIARVDIDLVMDPESISGALFDTPGIYRMGFWMLCHVEDPPRDDKMFMGKYTVTVAAATGEDKIAYDLLKSDPGACRAIYTHANATPAQAHILEEIATKAPHSAIAPHARMATVFLLVGNPATRGRALDELRAIARDYPNHPLAEDANQRLLQVLPKMGHAKEARELFDRMWQDPVATQRISGSAEILNRYANGPDPRKIEKENEIVELDPEWMRR